MSGFLHLAVLGACSPSGETAWRPWGLLPWELAWAATSKHMCGNTTFFHCFPTIFALIPILWKLTREMQSLPLYEGCLFPRWKSISDAHSDIARLYPRVKWKSTTCVPIFGGSAFPTFYNKGNQAQTTKETRMTTSEALSLYTWYFLYTHEVVCSPHAQSSEQNLPFLYFDSLQFHFTCSISPDWSPDCSVCQRE